jgi:hypothetical protein
MTPGVLVAFPPERDSDPLGRACRDLATGDAMGIDHLAKRFAEISIAHDGRGLVLLCY